MSAWLLHRLISSYFWADHVESVEDEAIKTDLHYNTADLRNISMQGDYNGSSKDDTRDAFFASLEKLVTNAFSESVELTRPFGQFEHQNGRFGFYS